MLEDCMQSKKQFFNQDAVFNIDRALNGAWFACVNESFKINMVLYKAL